jgi:putative hydrolase of the HAD superfamily
MTGAAVNWESFRLVVFDVDGTLYNQNRLRLCMLQDLIGHTIASRSYATLRVLRLYRKLRETIADQEVRGFDEILLTQTAREAGVEKARVQALVCEWIEQRPLPYIGDCRYPYVAEVFAALKRRDKIVGIFSDYPPFDKLRAMDLNADIVVSATDNNVGILKPNPRGLAIIMAAAGVGPQQTILIGDRTNRDGEAARRAGAAALIRSSRPIAGWACFSNFAAPQFSSLRDS